MARSSGSFISGEVQGAAEVVRRLEGVGRAVRKKLLKAAVNAASRPALRAMKGLAPVGETGLLRASLGRKVKVYRGSGVAVAIVGPRTGWAGKGEKRRRTALGLKLEAAGAQPTRYGHLVEKGTRPHALGKGSHVFRADRAKKGESQHGAMHPGARPHPFVAPALQQSQAPALEAMTQIVDEGIQRAAGGGQ